MFPLFYKQLARVLATRLAVIFRHLVTGGSFSVCWRSADVPVPKGSTSSNVGDYRPTCIRPVLPKVFEQIVAVS